MLDKLLGIGGASIVEAVGKAGDALFTSDQERLSADLKKAALEDRRYERQTEVNKIEAGHRSIFVAGWRPGLGWIGVIGLGVFFIPQYTVAAVVWSTACIDIIMAGGKDFPDYPVDSGALMELVLGLLGLGTLRTFEKFKGLTK